MGQVGDGTVVAPFANEAMRLLREDWKGKYGSKMLAEELFPILQTGIPNPDQNFQNFITINAGDTGSFAQLIDKYGNKLFEITAADGLKPIEPPGYPPPKLRPRIVWGPHTINVGDSIGGTELDAVAVDPETGATVAGAYVYSPPSGTMFSSAGTATLYVNFTPTDGVKYRRSMGSTVLTIQGPVVKPVPDINWSSPADIAVGTALSGTQLNATATDPVTHVSVPGIFTYTPPSGTVLSAGSGQNLHVDFVPTDTVTYDNASGDVNINVYTVTFVKSTSTGVFSGGNTAGNKILVAVGTYTGLGSTVSVSDTQGNSYTQIGSYAGVTYGGGTQESRGSLWYATVGTTGANTVSATSSDGGDNVEISAAEYRHAGALDSSAVATGAAPTSPASGTVTVGGAHELLVGVVFMTTSFLVGGGSGFALRVNNTTTGFEDKLDVSASADTTWNGSAAGAQQWVAFGVSFAIS